MEASDGGDKSMTRSTTIDDFAFLTSMDKVAIPNREKWYQLQISMVTTKKGVDLRSRFFS